ncbi:GNAT family N-acetyltransferase [Dyella sp. 2RAB6]|uniref:GNAT family N-acetyltransferase n=1 Tax=Dyella sp. 2RAB6 TaxID=3232992 RepID=UPI003F93EB15
MSTAHALTFPSLRAAWLPATGKDLPPGLSWREARNDDLPFFRLLYADIRAAELAFTPWPDAVRQSFLDSQFVLQHQHYTAHYQPADYLVIEDGGEPIGRLYVYCNEHEANVIDIALLSATRGRGIGSALLRLVQQAAQHGGLPSVVLHVEHRNSGARRLYERMGFALEEDIGSHLRMRWMAAAIELS